MQEILNISKQESVVFYKYKDHALLSSAAYQDAHKNALSCSIEENKCIKYIQELK